MSGGPARSIRFLLERWVQRGLLPQLGLMAVLVALVATLGGAAAWSLTPNFESLPAAIWWSFLRLTDPGYLGDDEGTTLRVVSTTVTVLGYVLFMGSLIAILTQWLSRTIRKLESGLTPIAMENHFVILGWTNRTPEIIKKLLSAGGRLERFLARRGGSHRFRVVVLADEVNSERRHQLRESLGDDWNEGQVFLRSGSSLQQDHLERLDLLRAAVVMVPGADFESGGAEMTDTRVVKTLLTLDALFRRNEGQQVPHVVAELFDPYKVPIARGSITVPTEVIAGDRLISRLLSQSMRQPGIATVLLSLLTHRESNTVYVRALPELEGESPRELTQSFSRAVVLGVVANEDGVSRVLLDPPQEYRLAADDLLIFFAERYDHCVPDTERRSAVEAKPPRKPTLPVPPVPARQRILVLGWSYKIPTLLEELLESSTGTFDVTVFSKVDVAARDRAFGHIDLGGRLNARNVHGDYAVEHELRALKPVEFDHILFLAGSWMTSSEEADARTVLGVLVLRSLLRGEPKRPGILVELLDPDNARILGDAVDVAFVSPRVLSHLLAHVGLRPELNAVLDALICAGGASIELHTPDTLGLQNDNFTFVDVQHAAEDMGALGLGFLIAPSNGAPLEARLNPARNQRWTLGAEDRVVVLSQERSESA